MADENDIIDDETGDDPPPRVPFRLAVLQALTNHLKTITPDNGYNYDLSQRVFRGRLMYGDGDPVPMVSILEAPLPEDPDYTPTAGETWKGPWRLFVQGWVEDDRMNPTDPAQLLLADVKVALAKARRQMARGGSIFGMARIMDLTVGASVVRPAEEHVNDYANFLLVVTLEIAENMADPYAV